MKKFLFVPATVVALSFAFNTAIASADEKKEGAEPKAGSVEEQMDNLVKEGPGVHNIKKDGKGRVLSLVIVGQSRISTVLGAAKGKEIARKKAEQSAKAAFVKWLGEAVVVCENAENETTLFLQGEEGNDKTPCPRQARRSRRTATPTSPLSAGLGARACNCSTATLNAEDKEYTVVYGWSLANAKAAKHTATNDPTIEEKPAAAESGEKKPSDKDAPGRRSAARRRPPRRRGVPEVVMAADVPLSRFAGRGATGLSVHHRYFRRLAHA